MQEKNNIYVGRIWELWRPILSLGKHILFYFSVAPCNVTNVTNVTNPTLFEQLLDLSVDLILEKEMEDTTDTGESLLLMGMLKTIIADNYYKISDLITAASEFTEVLPGWFNPRWIGRALKRLGFKEKRHRGKGVEYRFTPEAVKDMAERLGVSLPPLTHKATAAAPVSFAAVPPEISVPKLKSSVLGENGEDEIKYEQKNTVLKIKLTKNAEKCWNCEKVASEYEIQRFINGKWDCTSYNCKTCLFEKTIPAYQAQGAKIDIAAPEPTEEAS